MADVLPLRRAGADRAADPIPPLLVDARRAAELLGVSVRTFRTMDATGRLPEPVRLSRGIVRWKLDELRAWAEADCPDREEWAAIRAARK